MHVLIRRAATLRPLPAMSELSTVRAEIKEWERSFKETSGRAPTVDDIKANSTIADKYKLYKRLSKAAAASNSSQPAKVSAPPSTPPRTTRQKAPTSILRSKTQTVQPSAPLASFNPFSPQKKQKGKEKASNANNSSQEVRSRLFTKPIDPAARSQRQSLSPVPLPSTHRIRSPSPTSSTFPAPFAAPHAAVSRARKRLRGEPVSPSPNKDKRRRVSSQTTLPDEDEPPFEADSSFVDNSPIKPPMTGKSFPSLFEQELLPTDLFGVKANLGLTNLDSQNLTNKKKKPVNNVSRRRPPIRTAAVTIDDDTKSSSLQKRSNSPTSARDRNDRRSPNEVSSNRSSAKRALSDDEMEEASQLPSQRSKSPLIPPSPPAANSNSSFSRNNKSKFPSKKGTKSRKKVKVESDLVDNDDESDEVEARGKLKIVGRNTLRPQYTTQQLDDDGVMPDSDPILGYPRFAAPRAASPNTAQQDGIVEIDLPEQLRSVLALDTATTRVSEEDRLVKGLLYGRRVTHYDPNKGGEIWDVGEDVNDDERERQTEGEDDWEGEPVPWEVGEL
ncbi:hypothetical protein BJ912DRAFT_942642 [Pholiota molesta]|nr:hypothetical protein BJ912DRAFT_942642 [Pholiota molesta]